MPAEQCVDARNQNRQVERLRQVIIGPRFEPAKHVFGTAARGEHQNRRLPSLRAHARCHSKAIDAGQHHVEHHEVDTRRVGLDRFEGRFAVVSKRHLVAVSLEVEAQARCDVRFVFNNQESGHRQKGNERTVGADGSSRVNVAPRPTPSLCANARPPCRFAVCATMNRPRPVPLTRCVSAHGVR